jgi:FMN reductase
MSSLLSLRTVVHALRGWPTPFGAAVRTSSGLFDREGTCEDQAIADQLTLVGRQVVLGAERLAV